MSIKVLPDGILDALESIYAAGTAGWLMPAAVLSCRKSLPRPLRALIRRGLVRESERGVLVIADHPETDRQLWASRRRPVSATFLADLLALVGETIDERRIDGWCLQERFEVWSWASAEHLGAAGHRVKRYPRPEVLLPRREVAMEWPPGAELAFDGLDAERVMREIMSSGPELLPAIELAAAAEGAAPAWLVEMLDGNRGHHGP